MVYFVFYNDSLGNPIDCYGEWYDEREVSTLVKRINGGYYYIGVSEDEL